jgi:predicted PolB exonuclease-like 3'-5' exonuclease
VSNSVCEEIKNGIVSNANKYFPRKHFVNASAEESGRALLPEKLSGTVCAFPKKGNSSRKKMKKGLTARQMILETESII